MEWLKVFASFQSPLAPAALAARFAPPLSAQLDEETLFVSHENIDLSITECGNNEYLLRGEACDMPTLQAHLIPILKEAAESMQVDIFEEDGRLLKRITHIDAEYSGKPPA